MTFFVINSITVPFVHGHLKSSTGKIFTPTIPYTYSFWSFALVSPLSCSNTEAVRLDSKGWVVGLDAGPIYYVPSLALFTHFLVLIFHCVLMVVLRSDVSEQQNQKRNESEIVVKWAIIPDIQTASYHSSILCILWF